MAIQLSPRSTAGDEAGDILDCYEHLGTRVADRRLQRSASEPCAQMVSLVCNRSHSAPDLTAAIPYHGLMEEGWSLQTDEEGRQWLCQTIPETEMVIDWFWVAEADASGWQLYAATFGGRL